VRRLAVVCQCPVQTREGGRVARRHGDEYVPREVVVRVGLAVMIVQRATTRLAATEARWVGLQPPCAVLLALRRREARQPQRVRSVAHGTSIARQLDLWGDDKLAVLLLAAALRRCTWPTYDIGAWSTASRADELLSRHLPLKPYHCRAGWRIGRLRLRLWLRLLYKSRNRATTRASE